MSLLLLCVLLQLGHCQVRVPGMVYAWLDSQVTLDCQADIQEEIKQITWEKHRRGESLTLLTYRNDTGSKYHMEYRNRLRYKGNGYKDGSIEISNVSLVDEAVFKCVFTTFPSGTIEGTIQLQVTVLPTVRQELQQNITTPCLNLVAECLAFLAKPAAEIQWITNGINYTSEEDSITQSNGTMSKRSRLSMMTTPALFGREVSCLVYQPEIPSQYQKNITIDVNLTNIQFPPQMVQIEVFKNNQEVQQLLCKSDGNPRPEFIWKRRDKQKSEHLLPETSESLNFTDALGDGLYICEATNALGVNRGFIYIYTSKKSVNSHLGVLGSVIFVLLLLLWLCACYMFRSRWPCHLCKIPLFIETSLGKPLNDPQRELRKERKSFLEDVVDVSARVPNTKITNQDSDEESERTEATELKQHEMQSHEP